MKLMTISDLHTNADNIEVMKQTLVDYAIDKKVDLLFIAGDIADDIAITKKFVRDLNGFLKTYYLPGNHDLWNIINKRDTLSIYQEFLEDEYCLLNKALEISDKTVIIGHVGWYDYSFGQPKFTFEELERKEKDGIIWEDTKYIDFKTDDVTLCQQFNREIQELLTKYQDKQKVLITHMVNHERFLVKYTTRRDWSYFQGYLGSRDLQQLAYQADYAICAHVHYREVFEEKDTTFVCSCLGMPGEWQYFLPEKPLIEQIKHASFIVDLI